MITLIIKHDDGEREIFLKAKNMRELIDEKLPEWLPNLIAELPLLRQTQRFQKDPSGEENKERKSGWYYYL